MTNKTTHEVIEEGVAELTAMITQEDTPVLTPNWLRTYSQKLVGVTWQEAVELSDHIEQREPDGGTKQWMAFKAFRNTLRDKIKTLTKDTPAEDKIGTCQHKTGKYLFTDSTHMDVYECKKCGKEII